MRIPRGTFGGLLQGIMTGAVIFVAIFAVLLIARVDQLRSRLEARVRLITALETLEEEMDHLLGDLERRGVQRDMPTWSDQTGPVEECLGSLLLEPDLEEDFRAQLLGLQANLALFEGRLRLRTTGRDALSHRGHALRDDLHDTRAFTRRSNSSISVELNREWSALYALIYAALGLCLSVLVLLLVSRSRSRRLDQLRADLHQELGHRTRAEEALRLARDELEERVQARTGALTEANQRLHEEVEGRRRAQREATRIQGELVQAQKMESLGKLAGGVAHDFNNLMASIRGNTELLQRRLGPADPRRRYCEDVVQATLRAETLTRQLLAFSRHQPYEPGPVDLAALVQGFRSLLAPLIQADVALEIDLEEGRYIALADPNQLEQILLNLAVNARDAMPNGGRIRIFAEDLHLETRSDELPPEVTAGAYVRLTVEDNGPGIDEEILPRIFEPFFSTKGPGEGSGLGLSVVYGIVRHHGGWIEVDSAPGQGTAFHIHLPATEAVPKIPQPVRQDVTNTPSGGERILLVEDEEAISELAREILFEEGYEVECAGSLAEARASVDAAPGFDLLFTDMALPDGDGLNLAMELLTRDPGLKILLTSGYVDHLARWPLIRDRGFRLLRKPYLISALQTAIREVLDS